MESIMRKMFSPVALAALGFLLTQMTIIPSPALAQRAPAVVRGAAPRVLPEAVPPVTPQFNDPGAQMTIRPPGNPLQQLSPIEGLGPSPDSLGIK
jgi:hypothetical protein